jgi:cellulose biosynthesis protein BcsQ
MRVAVINMKGGCSKTTLVVSVGFVAEEKGYPLCVFDNDLQRNAVN